MVRAGADHGRDLGLGEPVPAGEAGAAVALHQAGGAVAVGVDGGAHADVARALLHDDAEDDALVDADLGALEHRVPDGAHVRARVARLEHLGLVGVEDLLEGLPLVHGGKVGRGSGVGCEAHFEIRSWVCRFKGVCVIVICGLVVLIRVLDLL